MHAKIIRSICATIMEGEKEIRNLNHSSSNSEIFLPFHVLFLQRKRVVK